MQNAKSQHKKVGPILATMVIIVILIAAAIYVFASRISQQTEYNKEYNAALNAATTTHTYTVQRIQGTSTDPRALESDLKKATEGLDI